MNGRRRREKIGPNRKLALTVLAKRRIEIAEGKFLDIRRKPKVLFRDFAREYLEYSRANKRSWGRDQTSLGNLLPVFGEMYLSDITPGQIERYKAQRLLKVKPATVNRELACLKHMFNKAIEWGQAASPHLWDG